MRLLFDFLLLTAVITACQAVPGTRFCFEACPYFTVKTPNVKISFKTLDEECKKVPWALKGTCDDIRTMDEEARKEADKDFNNLTWSQACRKYCHN